MQRHTLSALFLDMDPGEFQDLVESVKKHGLREPITVFQGEILDDIVTGKQIGRAHV